MRSGVVDVAAPTQSGMPTPDFLPEEPETSAQRLMHLQRFTLPCQAVGDAAAVVNPGVGDAGVAPFTAVAWLGRTVKATNAKPSGILPSFRVLVPIAKASCKLKNDRDASA